MGGEPGGVIPGDTPKLLIMWTLNYKLQFFLNRLRIHIKAWFIRLGCHFFSTWFFIDNDCICTTRNVLKLNRIYTYREGDNVDIVRLKNVHIERRYLYCSLFFFNINKIITVRQTMLKDAFVLWSLSDNREFEEVILPFLKHF